MSLLFCSETNKTLRTRNQSIVRPASCHRSRPFRSIVRAGLCTGRLLAVCAVFGRLLTAALGWVTWWVSAIIRVCAASLPAFLLRSATRFDRRSAASQPSCPGSADRAASSLCAPATATPANASRVLKLLALTVRPGPAAYRLAAAKNHGGFGLRLEREELHLTCTNAL
jgi:hypothetical protein